MQLYLSNTRQYERAVRFRQPARINCLQDLLQAAQYDHIFSQMRDNYRNGTNFLATNCLELDLDNTHSDDPDEWKSADDIAEAFPEVQLYYVYSRNHMKPKRDKQGRIHEPRPKMHAYMPLSHTIKDHDEAEQLMSAARMIMDHTHGQEHLFDQKAAHPEQMIYGVENPQGGEIEGDLCIDEYLLRPEVQAIWAPMLEKEKDIEQKQTSEAGPDLQQVGLDWIEAVEQRRGVDWLEKWAQEHGVSLGRRYGIKAGNHAGAIVYPVKCPWESSHTTDGGEYETVIIVDRGGKLNYLCRHDHCTGHDWKEYRQRIEITADFDEETPEPVIVTKTAEEYQSGAISSYVSAFMTDAANHPEPIPTGWKTLDKILGGGLYPGLYVLGALSSFGKTTFAEQLAVHLSETGHDVLFFSLEMTKYELMARGISRLTACLECGEKEFKSVAEAANMVEGKDKKTLTCARTAVDLINPQTFLHLNHDEQQLVNKAAALYRERTGRLWVIEQGEGAEGKHTRVDVDCIYRKIEEHKAITGVYPVVFIDYLQIIAGSDLKSDKANIDDFITRLRKMSRGRYPVIAISSFNRGNYNTEASMSAFKESGSIEYSADVLLAIEPRGMNNNTTDSATAKNKDVIKETTNRVTWPVQLSIIKNRLGRRDLCINYDYTAKYNVYEEIGESERKDPEKKKDRAPSQYSRLVEEVQGLRTDLQDAVTAIYMRTNPGASAPVPDDLDDF